MTGNKFTSFRPWKLETLLTAKACLYTNLLRTIILLLVNKNYYIVIIFLSYVSPFAYKSFLFPLLRWSIPELDSNLERIFSKTKKKKFLKIIQNILCQMVKYNLFLSTNVLLFDVLTILIHHFMLFFSSLSQKKEFYFKRKNNTKSSCMIFFLRILCRMDIYFKRLIIYQMGITMNIISST